MVKIAGQTLKLNYSDLVMKTTRAHVTTVTVSMSEEEHELICKALEYAVTNDCPCVENLDNESISKLEKFYTHP